MYLLKVSVSLLLMITFVNANAQKGEDVFVGLGQQDRVKSGGLQKNPVTTLPDTILPWDVTAGGTFPAGDIIETQQQLDSALQAMRSRYAPFLSFQAPAMRLVRKRVPLDSFEYKLVATEMGQDIQGNPYPLPGLLRVGDSVPWQMVSIPHYCGPINKAEAIYRRELVIRQDQLAADKLFLHFNGVDYIARVYVNGNPVGEHTGLFGAFEFDIKKFLRLGKNLLEVKVYNDALMMGDSFFTGPGRKFGKKLGACGGPGWDEPGYGKGWVMCPPGFGIWQNCYLESRSGLYVHDLEIRPLVDASKAEVSVEVPEGIKDAIICYSLYGQNFNAVIAERKVVDKPELTMQPGGEGFRVVKFLVDIPAGALRLWSPDTPWLYQLQISLMRKGKLVDTYARQFGMRSFDQSSLSSPKGKFYLNGREIKLRGANMMGNIMQCVIRNDYKQLTDDILLAKIAGMNFWRMTQQPCQEEAYDYFDKLGLMAQTDMPAFNGYRKDAVPEARAQFVEMMRLVRSHPCNAVITYLNEPDFSKPMMLTRDEHRLLFNSFDSVAAQMNPGQVTKWIDGDYVNLSPGFSDHHDYDIWYGNGIRSVYEGGWFDTHAGWMYGCGEFGAEGLDDTGFMRKHYPDAWLRVNDEGKWEPKSVPRCQTQAMAAKWLVLKDSSMQDWTNASREYQAWAIRLFTESLRRNNNLNSLAVHLLIDAWPAGWLKALVDADRRAKPAYFAYLNALRPLAVNLRPDAFYGFAGDTASIAVFLCNDKPDPVEGAHLRYEVRQGDNPLYTGNIPVTVSASRADFEGKIRFVLPEVQHREAITVRAGLFDAAGKWIHESSYDIEVYPGTERRNKPDRPGGYAQALISR